MNPTSKVQGESIESQTREDSTIEHSRFWRARSMVKSRLIRARCADGRAQGVYASTVLSILPLLPPIA